MATVAIGDGLDQHGALAARMRHRRSQGLVHCHHILAVNAAAVPHAVGLRALVQQRLAGCFLNERAHAVAVVLDQPDDRQLPHGGEVERLVEIAVVGRAIAHKGEHHFVAAAVLRLQRDARGQRQMPADNGEAAPEVVFAAGQMHRTALAAADARALAHHLRHQGGGRDAARQRDAVITIGCDDVIALVDGGQRAHAHRLLAAVEMQVDAGDALLLVEFVTGFLEFANQHHLPVPVQQGLNVGKRCTVCVCHSSLHRTRRGAQRRPADARAPGEAWSRAQPPKV